MAQKLPAAISDYMAKLGSRGGKSTSPAKVRSASLRLAATAMRSRSSGSMARRPFPASSIIRKLAEKVTQ